MCSVPILYPSLKGIIQIDSNAFLYFINSLSCPFLRCQDHLDLKLVSNRQNIYQVLNGQRVIRSQYDGHVADSKFDGLERSLQFVEWNLILVDKIVFFFGNGEGDLLLVERLIGGGFGQKQFDHIGIGESGHQQEKEQQEEHDVIHRSGRNLWFELKPFP